MSQLITAVITIITTIIVVRVTLKGGLDVSQTLAAKLRATASKYGKYTLLMITVFGLVGVSIALYRWVWLNRFDIPNRAEVFWISFFVVVAVFLLIQFINELFNTGLLRDTPRHQSETK